MSSAASTSLEHAGRNGNVKQRTSHTMMMMMMMMMMFMITCTVFEIGYYQLFPKISRGHPEHSPTGITYHACASILVNINNLHTKFDIPSFTHSKIEIMMVPKILVWVT